jgi:hypothetical protein
LAQNIPVEAVVEYLLQAPRIARDLAPVGWKFLDPPRDGTIMLVWQPPQLETHFASDGLIWADAEYAFDTNARGYVSSEYIARILCMADGDRIEISNVQA